METAQHEVDDVQFQMENLKAAIREISHEISNATGVLRMAAYFLETTDPEPEKKAHYLSLINSGLDQVEANLKRLKILRENPTKSIKQLSDPATQ